MVHLAPRLALLALLVLALPACTSDDAASTQRPAAGPTAPATSDSGSRFLDAAAPVGGVTAETPPVLGRYEEIETGPAAPAFAPFPAALPAPQQLPTPPPPPPPSWPVTRR